MEGPKHSRRTCCQNGYERPYIHAPQSDISEGENLLAFLLGGGHGLWHGKLKIMGLIPSWVTYFSVYWKKPSPLLEISGV